MKNPKITIIDYGIRNVHSVYNSIKADINFGEYTAFLSKVILTSISRAK